MTIKKNSLFLVLLVYAFATALSGQIDTERVPPALDNADLYNRLAASRLVVIGTLAKTEGVGKRLTPSIREQMKANLSAGTGGGLLIVQTEEIICRQSDFDPNAPVVAEGPQSLYMFIPFDDPFFVDGSYREQIVRGQRYLLFLVELDDKQTRELTEIYELDPNRVYYRGKQRNRGVILLSKPTPQDPSPKQPEILGRVVQLCDAMRPPNPKEKLAALKKLVESDDPILQKEAAIAVQTTMQAIPGKQEHRPRK